VKFYRRSLYETCVLEGAAFDGFVHVDDWVGLVREARLVAHAAHPPAANVAATLDETFVAWEAERVALTVDGVRVVRRESG
jgi:hypothetical protein